MAQQNLKTIVTIGGGVDNSFGKMGDSLLALGSQIDLVSRKVINFGKDSVEQFAGYEDIMLLVQKLGGYSDKTMKELDAYNSSIAQTSKFTVQQAAQAELLMARLGLSLEDTKTMMPTVLNLATAAEIDLATSLDYLYYSVSALGKPMSYANTLSDQMAKTADISAAGIDTLGESLQRLGSGASFFAGGSSELLAILGGIAQFGADMQGTSAGTQLRNFMLTLLAPTKSKQSIIDSFSVSDAEWAEFETYMEDAGINVTETAEAMNNLGLSVYDAATGELKPAIQIIGEMNAALSTMSKEEQNKTLGQLFGKRTTTTAKNLITAYEDIIAFQKVIAGESEGYTEELAEAAESGLGGSLRSFAASWGELKTTFGENIAPEVMAISGFMHDAVVDISNMDETKLATLTGALEGIALAGPGMLIAGGALKLIGFAATPFGATALGISAAAVAIGAVVKGVNAYNEIEFESHFGDLELDTEALEDHLQGITDAFTSSYSEMNAFSDALNAAVDSYETASSTLSSDLLTSMITGATLTQEQIDDIRLLGDQMGLELKKGIQASFDASESYLSMLFGEGAASDPDYIDAMGVASRMELELMAEAYDLGNEFGKALGAAMDDGIITGDEYNVIMKKMQAYNEAMAFAQHADRQAELAKELHKAQSVNWDSAEDFLENQEALLAQTLADSELTHVGEMAKWGVYYDEAIRRGKSTEAEKNEFLEKMDAQYAEMVKGYEEENARVTWAVIDALMSQSDYGDAWQYIRSIYGAGGLHLDENGALQDTFDYYSNLPNGMTVEEMSDAMGDLAEYSKKLLGQFKDVLPEDSYEMLSGMLNKSMLEMISNRQGSWATANSGQYDALWAAIAKGDEAAYEAAYDALSFKQKRNYGKLVDDITKEYTDLGALFGDDQHAFAQVNSGYRMDYAAYKLLYGTEQDPLTVQATVTGLQESAAVGHRAVQSYLNSNPLIAPVRTKYQTPSGYGGLAEYADGGRATEASIFGEAGAEWAIPEEHSQNTARLIWQAAQASGFSWGDIAEANGSPSARSGNTLVYSPTIIANDATGVEDKLQKDKLNLQNWLKEKELKDKITVYA